MTKHRSKNVKYLRKIARGTKDETKAMADNIIEKYDQARISQLQTVENVLFKLITNDKRVHKSGVRLYDKVLSKYAKQKPLNQRLDEKKL